MTTSARSPDLLERHRDLRRLREMALGFGIGSVLFGAGAACAITSAATNLINVLYAVGAVFFTFAAGVQLFTALDHRPQDERVGLHKAIRNPDLMSAAIQLVGTVYFNAMTIRALLDANYASIWTPDVLGSMAFLISSGIAWYPIARERRHALVSLKSRAICWANLAGSIFFALSAWGAELLSPGVYRSIYWDNAGTLLGAIGFLVASVLLWPERTSDAT